MKPVRRDPSKTQRKRWRPKTTFAALVEIMVGADLERVKSISHNHPISTVDIPHILSAYSLIALSLENFPARAILSIAIRVHRSGSK